MKITKEQKNFYLTWVISDACNYKCPYCFKNFNERTFPKPSLVEERAKKIHSLLQKSPEIPFKFKFMGGEPTLHDLHTLLDLIFNENIDTIVIGTNLSAPIEYYLSFIDKVENVLHRHCKLYASLHETEVGVDDFLKKYIQIQTSFPDSISLNYVICNKEVYDLVKNSSVKKINWILPFKKGHVIDTTFLKEVESTKGFNLIKVDGVLKNRFELEHLSTKGANCSLNSMRIKSNGDIVVGHCIENNIPIGNIDSLKEDFKIQSIYTHTCSGNHNCSFNGFSEIDLINK